MNRNKIIIKKEKVIMIKYNENENEYLFKSTISMNYNHC